MLVDYVESQLVERVVEASQYYVAAQASLKQKALAEASWLVFDAADVALAYHSYLEQLYTTVAAAVEVTEQAWEQTVAVGLLNVCSVKVDEALAACIDRFLSCLGMLMLAVVEKRPPPTDTKLVVVVWSFAVVDAHRACILADAVVVVVVVDVVVGLDDRFAVEVIAGIKLVVVVVVDEKLVVVCKRDVVAVVVADGEVT